jgi:predicted phosphodiesterase
MRIAVVSDTYGNPTAFEAVLADLLDTSPDLILHGGDLPHGGARPKAALGQFPVRKTSTRVSARHAWRRAPLKNVWSWWLGDCFQAL